MTTDRTLSLSTVTRIIKAPLEKVNIADWLLNLPDAEYQRCSHVHIAAGHTTSDDGRPMSITVETIGETLMVQHFVAQVLEPHFCRLTSTSDAITMKGRTKVHLLWELRRNSCYLVCFKRSMVFWYCIFYILYFKTYTAWVHYRRHNWMGDAGILVNKQYRYYIRAHINH